ncbi:MAG: hypothetical protein Q4E75_06600 [bacterium]|nr:hypothetical protein [bacterium]
MYITNTSEKVIDLFDKIDELNSTHKVRFILYVFDLLNNNQINDKNQMNPDLYEKDDLEIFNAESIGFPPDFFDVFLYFNVMVYNKLVNSTEAYLEYGNVMGIENKTIDMELASKFSKLNYNEKLDVISELIIRYDNETYFNEEISMMPFASDRSGFDIAKAIQDFKK